MFDTLLGLIVLLISAAITTAIIRRLLLGVGWVRSFLVSLVVFSVSVPVTNWAATALGILSPDGKLGVDGGVALGQVMKQRVYGAAVCVHAVH